jgi:hypothetical protein
MGVCKSGVVDFDVPSVANKATPHQLRYQVRYAPIILYVTSRDNHVI